MAAELNFVTPAQAPYQPYGADIPQQLGNAVGGAIGSVNDAVVQQAQAQQAQQNLLRQSYLNQSKIQAEDARTQSLSANTDAETMKTNLLNQQGQNALAYTQKVRDMLDKANSLYSAATQDPTQAPKSAAEDISLRKSIAAQVGLLGAYDPEAKMAGTQFVSDIGGQAKNEAMLQKAQMDNARKAAAMQTSIEAKASLEQAKEAAARVLLAQKGGQAQKLLAAKGEQTKYLMRASDKLSSIPVELWTPETAATAEKQIEYASTIIKGSTNPMTGAVGGEGTTYVKPTAALIKSLNDYRVYQSMQPATPGAGAGDQE